MKTTLNRIREHNPCTESWNELLKHLGKTEADDENLELRTILDLLGIDDAIWALRSIEGIEKEMRLFACDCAESVLHIFEKEYPNDNRPRKAIEVSRLFAEGKATEEELKAARDAARDAWGARAAKDARYAWAASDAARAAAWDAAWDAARDARYAWAAWDAEKEKQKQLFIKYFC